MIVDIPNTTVSKISKSLIQIREQGGAVALGRVLTLVIETNFKGIEPAIAAANEASREHPCRIIVLADDDSQQQSEPRLDAQIRVGGDAGASEVIVLRAFGAAASAPESLVTGLLLPDAPVVAWWPGETPENVSESAIGRIATRRITDAANQPDAVQHLRRVANSYSPGDSDFAWTRLTLWRAQLAAILDQPPYQPILSVTLVGATNSPSTDLLASWLELKLQVPIKIDRVEPSERLAGIRSVTFHRTDSDVAIIRDEPDLAKLIETGKPPREISLPRRSLRDCLSEDLRRLDADTLFGKVVRAGFGG